MGVTRPDLKGKPFEKLWRAEIRTSLPSAYDPLQTLPQTHEHGLALRLGKTQSVGPL